MMLEQITILAWKTINLMNVQQGDTIDTGIPISAGSPCLTN